MFQDCEMERDRKYRNGRRGDKTTVKLGRHRRHRRAIKRLALAVRRHMKMMARGRRRIRRDRFRTRVNTLLCRCHSHRFMKTSSAGRRRWRRCYFLFQIRGFGEDFVMIVGRIRLSRIQIARVGRCRDVRISFLRQTTTARLFPGRIARFRRIGRIGEFIEPNWVRVTVCWLWRRRWRRWWWLGWNIRLLVIVFVLNTVKTGRILRLKFIPIIRRIELLIQQRHLVGGQRFSSRW